MSELSTLALQVAALFTVLYSSAFILFFFRLRGRHRAEWERMGSPNPFFNYLFFKPMAPIRRLLRGDGLAELRDHYLALIARLTVVLWIVAVLGFAVGVVAHWLARWDPS